MSDIQKRLNQAVDITENDSSLFHAIVHGDELSTVNTENGEVPTVAKAIKDIRVSITSDSNDIVEIAQTSAEIAREKAIICQESEKIVSEKVLIADNAKIWAEGSDEEVAKEGGTHSARGWVELARKSTIGSYPTTINGIAIANQVLLPLSNDVLGTDNQILSVIIENTALLPENYRLSSDGKSVVLVNPLSSGERWSVKYLHDIQTLSNLVGAIVYEDM